MLREALQSRDFAHAKTLLENGGKLPPDIQDYAKTSIFDTIVREKAFDIVDLLIADGTIEMDIYEYDDFEKSIFKSIIAHLGNDEASLDFLNGFLSKVQSLNDELGGKTFFSYALEAEADIEILKTMVDNGCDVNTINSAEENLVHQVVKKYARNYDKGLQYLRFLYDEGVDIDKPNVVGETPLNLAVKQDRNEYIKWLMENGSDANVQNKDGKSAFFTAATQGGGPDKYEVMRQFSTPEFDQITSRGESLLYEAVRMMSSVDESDLKLFALLLEDGADLYCPSTDYGNEVTTVDALADKTSGLLQIALDSGQLDVDRKDNAGNTLLHKICDRETLHEEKRAKEVYRMVKMLLAAGADANVTNDAEQTPMMIASNDNMKTKTVELLLSRK